MNTLAPSPRRAGRTVAFTLIELLTVIAVIGVLAGLLIPVVGKVRATARSASSVSNLRQCGMAVLQHADENKGLLPDRDLGNTNSWHRVIYRRTVGRELPAPYGDDGTPLVGTVLFSPAHSTDEPTPWRTYGWNKYIQLGSVPPVTISRVVNASRFVLMADVIQSSQINLESGQFNLYGRNSGKVHLLFADVHVSSRLPSEIPTDPNDPLWKRP